MVSLWCMGATMNERRSAAHAGVQLDWVDTAMGEGVGARQAHDTAPAGGGGYLNECTSPELWDKAKLRELTDMGLPQVWLLVAHELGYDAFLRLWRTLDAAVELRSDTESMIEVQLRRYSSFQRFQRNRYIETLVDQGLNNRQIRARVKVDIGEELSPKHIGRLANRRRVQA